MYTHCRLHTYTHTHDERRREKKAQQMREISNNVMLSAHCAIQHTQSMDREREHTYFLKILELLTRTWNNDKSYPPCLPV